MRTYTVVTYNGFDYWLYLDGRVDYKPSSRNFWSVHFGDLPSEVKRMLGVSKRQIITVGWYPLSDKWSD